jgi:NAD(P)-dependent dehydrogenase (short-subunit alcohol dehydrogenase family)
MCAVSALDDIFGLTDRVAVVTGGARGIGAAAAQALHAAGARVVVTGRNLSALPEAGADGRPFAARLAMDVTVSDSVKSVADEVKERFGRIDILVNNAGQSHVASFEATSESDFEHMLNTNFLGVVRCCREFGKHMVDAGYGRVINVGSTAGVRGRRMETAYSGSKGAVIAFSKSLAMEWARSGVTVHNLCPGYIETDMNASFLAKEENRRAIERRIPMGRVGQPDEFAAAIVFLVSQASSYMTGTTVMIDGGTVAR